MRNRSVALLVVPLLALSACSGGDEVAEERPEYANEEGPVGAEKFAGYWVEEVNAATESGDTEDLRALGLEGCEACSDFPQQLDDIYDAGGRVESEEWELDSVIREGGASDEEVGMLLTVKVPPQKVYETEDAEPQEFPGGDQKFRMIVVREDDHWMIKDLTPR